MLPKDIYLTDARETPGQIYRVREGIETVLYSRPSGNIYSLAFSPTGGLYFVNANERVVYRLHFMPWLFGLAWTTRIFTHTTYVRDLAFDRGGKLYFSEATGAGGDGRIYRLEGGAATLYQEVPVSDVGGFWAGNFAFDTGDRIYVSSGNRIPASIWRLERPHWTEVFTSASAPIKGLEFLACDLLSYANWRSEVYVLDIGSGDRELVYSKPTHLWISDVAFYRPRIQDETLYEGTKAYTCDVCCWRDDGTLDSGTFFPGIDAKSPEIAALLSDIGAPTAPTSDAAQIWDRTRTVWSWLQDHGLSPADPHYEDVKNYRAGLGHWPSIAEYAHVFKTWGGFFWSGCTCMCRAHTFATLLYRTGIPADRMAIAESRWKPSYSQHMYVVLRLGCHWYYVDPSTNLPALPATPSDIGSGDADYRHPNNLTLLPGSTLARPMLVR